MDEQIKQIDSWNNDGKFAEITPVLDKLLSEDPDNPELLYRKVRLLYRLNADETDPKKKEALLREAVDIAKAALEKHPNHADLHKWMAIALGRMVDYTSLNEKIANSWKIREHADKSLEVRPTDAVTLHVVGKWCESVAKVGWIERKIAAALFSTPPTATYEEAYGFFVRCEEADPLFKENTKALGDICLLMGKKPEAKQWYEKALALPAKSEADKRMDTEMSTAVKKL